MTALNHKWRSTRSPFGDLVPFGNDDCPNPSPLARKLRQLLGSVGGLWHWRSLSPQPARCLGRGRASGRGLDASWRDALGRPRDLQPLRQATTMWRPTPASSHRFRLSCHLALVGAVPIELIRRGSSAVLRERASPLATSSSAGTPTPPPAPRTRAPPPTARADEP